MTASTKRKRPARIKCKVTLQPVQIDLKSLDEPLNLRRSCVYGRKLKKISEPTKRGATELKTDPNKDEQLQSLLGVNVPNPVDLQNSKLSVKEPVFTKIANSPQIIDSCDRCDSAQTKPRRSSIHSSELPEDSDSFDALPLSKLTKLTRHEKLSTLEKLSMRSPKP